MNFVILAAKSFALIDRYTYVSLEFLITVICLIKIFATFQIQLMLMRYKWDE